jgi:hypothetical protein
MFNQPSPRVPVMLLVVFLAGPVLVAHNARAHEASSAAPVILAADDRAASVIVIPDTADRRSMEQQTAALIVWVVERMAGVQLPILRESDLGHATIERGCIVPEAGKVPAAVATPCGFVLVGETRLAETLGVTAEGLGVGGMRLTTSGNSLVLLGGPTEGHGHSDSGGVRYAAIELLERLGCRYLWPGELGLVVPRTRRIAVPHLDLVHTPKIGRRGIRFSPFLPRDERSIQVLQSLDIPGDQWQQIWQDAVRDPLPVSWHDWQRLGGQMPNFGHAGAGLRDAGWALRERPEWFALQSDGTRDQHGIDRWRLCKSNPDLIAHVADDIIRRRNEDPSLVLVSLCPNDGGYSSWCLCDACRALDPADGPPITLLRFERAGSSRRTELPYVSLTDRLLFYWNRIAERVTAVHPDLLFGVSAYSRFSDPPVERRLHPNLVVRYVRSDHEGWKGWQQAGAQRIFWRPNILLINRRHGKLQSIVGEMADHMSYFADHGMTMTDISSITHHWATLGLTYYATARLNWNPHLSGDEIIADYARHGFGPAAEFIERYFHRVERLTAAGLRAVDEDEGDQRVAGSSVPLLAELRGLLNAAEQAAGDDRAIADRIAFLRLGLNFTELQDELDSMARRATAGESVDRDRARLLVDLNGLVLRDLLRRHPLAIHVPSLVQQSAAFAHRSAIRGRRISLSDETLQQRLTDPRFGLTGREQSIGDMLQAFGLEDL